MIDLTELNKLEQMLIDEGIPYRRIDKTEDCADKFPDLSVYEFHQLHSIEEHNGTYLWDVICNTGSYGSDVGALEMWGLTMREPEGWLSAENCIDKIRKMI